MALDPKIVSQRRGTSSAFKTFVIEGANFLIGRKASLLLVNESLSLLPLIISGGDSNQIEVRFSHGSRTTHTSLFAK